MVDQQFGVGERQANVAGDYFEGDVDQRVFHIRRTYVGIPPDLGDDDDYDSDSSEYETGSGSGAAAAGGGGVGLLIVLALAGYWLFGGDEPFPTTSDPWPADAKQEVLAGELGGWLDKCAKSSSVSPANCPQELSETSEVSAVHWAFYGNPTEGVDIKFNEAESLFDVFGSAVVWADYTVSKEVRNAVMPTTYWAKVKWVDGKFDVQEIKEHSTIGDPKVVKKDPNLAWELQAAKLQGAFTRCVRGAKTAMPAGCPDWRPPSGAKKIKWSSARDPLLTARPTFDASLGIYRVRGSYEIDVRYTPSSGIAKTEQHASKYEALIAPTATGPVVLHIKDAI